MLETGGAQVCARAYKAGALSLIKWVAVCVTEYVMNILY